MARRFVQLLVGLTLCGLAIAAMVRANLGLGPWDVLHQALARRTGLSLGAAVILVSAAVLILWIPLRQRPGIGTVVNIFMIGAVADVGLAILPTPTEITTRLIFVALGVIGTGIGASIYLGARLGPGARDGLMTGVVHRFNRPVHVGRTAIELSALFLGWVGGGVVGLGTLAFALGVGPVIHASLPWFDYQRWPRADPESEASRGA